MTIPVEKINAERLGEWRRKLDREHATAFVLIGVGHDHLLGTINICMCKNTEENEIAKLFREVATMIEKQQTEPGR